MSSNLTFFFYLLFISLQGKNNISFWQFFWACCFGQLNNFFGDDNLGYSFPTFSCSNKLFYALKTLCDDVSYAGTTFIFSSYLKSFLILNLHLNNFLLSRA